MADFLVILKNGTPLSIATTASFVVVRHAVVAEWHLSFYQAAYLIVYHQILTSNHSSFLFIVTPFPTYG
jgi:hypothetical protein